MKPACWWCKEPIEEDAILCQSCFDAACEWDDSEMEGWNE